MTIDDPIVEISPPSSKLAMILSEKDRHQPRFCDMPDLFTYP